MVSSANNTSSTTIFLYFNHEVSCHDQCLEIIKLKAMDQEEQNSRYKRWKESTKALLSAVRKETCQPYSIPVVPDKLRQSEESAYIPKVVSIGPQYRGRRELLQAEEIKWRCVTTLLSRTFGLDAIEKCMEAVLELDATVRSSYVAEIKLDKYDLATTMVFDGCFLLELLICDSKYDSELPIPFEGTSPGKEVKQMEYVLSDLLLLDNQIPIYILEKLFENLLGSSLQMRELIQNLALPVFGFSGKYMVKSTFHFLDIAYSYLEMEWNAEKIEAHGKDNKFTVQDQNQNNKVPVQDQNQNNKVPVQDQNLNRCATRLKAVGITIQLHDINKIFISTTQFDKYTRILTIPKLEIEHTTEAMWRSFIAWELHKKKLIGSSSVADRRSTCTSSALLFSDLICCTADVQLLKDKGIIVDSEKSKANRDQLEKSKTNRDLVDFFHKIAEGVDRDTLDFNHIAMFKAMNTVSSANYATKVFILLHHYFCIFLDWCYSVHKFFKRGYNYAFTIVGFLTLVQTCYSIVAYHFPKK